MLKTGSYVKQINDSAPPVRKFTWEVVVKKLFFSKICQKTNEESKGCVRMTQLFLTVETPLLSGNTQTLVFKFYESKGELRVLPPNIGLHSKPEPLLIQQWIPAAVKMFGLKKTEQIKKEINSVLKASV